jgi:hypothetical protein
MKVQQFMDLFIFLSHYHFQLTLSILSFFYLTNLIHFDCLFNFNFLSILSRFSTFPFPYIHVVINYDTGR